MDRINKTVIITLDFFEIINGFEKEGETDKPGGEEDNCQHFSVIFAQKWPNWMPDRPSRISSESDPPDVAGNPVKMKK